MYPDLKINIKPIPRESFAKEMEEKVLNKNADF